MDYKNFISRFGNEIILVAANYLPATPDMTSHAHIHYNILHITYVWKGRGKCIMNDRSWSLVPGYLHTVLPGEFHEYRADCRRPYEIYFLHFVWYGPAPTTIPRYLKIPPKNRYRFRKQLHELSTLYRLPDAPEMEFRRYALLGLVFADILKFAAWQENNVGTSFQPLNGSDSEFTPVFELLYGPPFSYPGIDALAEVAGMERRTFTNWFRKTTGRSPKQYFLLNVMRYAKAMIASGEMKIKDLAIQCGYSNPQNFIAAWKKFSSAKKQP